MSGAEKIRLDIWLWRARFYKTRALAAKAITKKRFRLQRGSQILRLTKAHNTVMPGDQLIFVRGERLYEIEIVDLGHRRGPAVEAKRLYQPIHQADE